MTVLVVVAGSVLVSCGALLTFWALTTAGADPVRSNLTRGALVDSRQIALSASARTRLLDPAVRTLARRVRSLTSSQLVARVQRGLELSGLASRGWTVERILVLRGVSLALTVPIVILLLSGGTSRQRFAVAGLVIVVGLLGPQAWLDRRARERQTRIEKQLPDVIDQLSVSVDAGLGFDAAMSRSAEGRTGPLADELARVIQDLQIGVSRQDALDRLVARTDVPDLRSFVIAVRQSTRLGLPIARVLRVQAQELRDKRRARIEQQAAQLPVKIVFPLVFCILPSLFVVILGPAGLDILDTF